MTSLRARIKPGAGYWQRTGPHNPHRPCRYGIRWDRFPHEDTLTYYGPVLILVRDDQPHPSGDVPFETLHPVPGNADYLGNRPPPARVTGWIHPTNITPSPSPTPNP